MVTTRALAVEADDAWLDEIDLDPAGAWLRMGTRNLGSRPWLVADGKRRDELKLKRSLLTTRFHEVFAVEGSADTAAAETLALVTQAVDSLVDGTELVGVDSARLHPLDKAGRLVQEDLCLLRPTEHGTWVLAAASLCFPSRWRLAAKIGLGLNAVHDPVPDYDPTLTSRVDSLMTTLASQVPASQGLASQVPASQASAGGSSDDRATADDGRVVWRRNWFIHPDPSLFQPDRPAVDPIVESDACLDGLHLRSERQTLRALPRSGWMLFAIRTQQASLRQVVANEQRLVALLKYLREAEPDLLAHRGVCERQRQHLLEALR